MVFTLEIWIRTINYDNWKHEHSFFKSILMCINIKVMVQYEYGLVQWQLKLPCQRKIVYTWRSHFDFPNWIISVVSEMELNDVASDLINVHPSVFRIQPLWRQNHHWLGRKQQRPSLSLHSSSLVVSPCVRSPRVLASSGGCCRR